jgi:ribokinase
MAAVVVVGSSNTDMVVPVRRIPRVGETVLGDDLLVAAGGKGANQAVAAARLGARVIFVGAIGDDAFGGARLADLRSEGIDCAHVRTVTGVSSGVALIMVDDDGRNCIAVSSGANAHLSEEDANAAADAIRGTDVLLAQLETPLPFVHAALRHARDAGTLTVLNPAPVPSEGLPDDLLALVDVLTPNEGEAAALTGDDGEPRDLARALIERGVGAVVVTLGERGAVIATGDGMEAVAAEPVRAVDTTAAGDAFSGALAVALAEGSDLQKAARFANVAAARSVTRRGAQPSMPRRDEVGDA